MQFKNLVIFFLFVSTLVQGCNNKQPAVSKPSAVTGSVKKKNTARIEFTEEIHNFGTLKEGEVVSYSFKFKNNGGDPLRLVKVVPACSCLNVRYQKEDVDVSGTSYIEVIFNSAGEWGNQIKSVEIETSAGQLKTLTVAAFVENQNINVDLNN